MCEKRLEISNCVTTWGQSREGDTKGEVRVGAKKGKRSVKLIRERERETRLNRQNKKATCSCCRLKKKKKKTK